MRGLTPGVRVPVPLVETLPAIFQEDAFTNRWLEGFDDSLAPVFSTLDALGAYVDPMLSPTDFLDWLGGWVGMVLDEDWPVERRREVILRAVDLYRLRGTPEGLRREVAILTGGDVEINESGGAAYSPTPGGDLPGEGTPRIAVRVLVDDPDEISERALDALVRTSKPAHVIHRVEVAARTAPAPAKKAAKAAKKATERKTDS